MHILMCDTVATVEICHVTKIMRHWCFATVTAYCSCMNRRYTQVFNLTWTVAVIFSVLFDIRTDMIKTTSLSAVLRPDFFPLPPPPPLSFYRLLPKFDYRSVSIMSSHFIMFGGYILARLKSSLTPTAVASLILT